MELREAQDRARRARERSKNDEENEEDLDAYMASISQVGGNSLADKENISRLKLKLSELEKETARVDRLVKMVTPTLLPTLVKQDGGKAQEGKSKKSLMSGVMFGKRKGGGFKQLKTIASAGVVQQMEEPKAVLSTNPAFEAEDKSSGKKGGRKSLAQKLKEDAEEDERLEREAKLREEEEAERLRSTLRGPAMMPPEAPEAPEEVNEAPVDKFNRETVEQPEESLPEEPPVKKFRKNRTRKRNKGAGNVKEDEEEDGEEMEENPKVEGDYDTSDDKYATWMPPKGQTGDGKTSLNEKLGY